MFRLSTLALLLIYGFCCSAYGDIQVPPANPSLPPLIKTTDPFIIPIKLRQAKNLYNASRFRDAEVEFVSLQRTLKSRLKDHHSADFDKYLQVLEYLAQSRSQQGRRVGVMSHVNERHQLIKSHYDHNGYMYAKSLMTLAEVHYRANNRAHAVALVESGMKILSVLNPVPASALKRARHNHMQYRITEFTDRMLPMDLSEFHSRCETLQRTGLDSTAIESMETYTEVGVDYIPEGNWKIYFDNIMSTESSTDNDSVQRRVFIPASHEIVREVLCVIEIDSGTVINAESIYD